jgi:hypothetical protein
VLAQSYSKTVSTRTSSRDICAGVKPKMIRAGMSWVDRDPPEPIEYPLVKLKVMSHRRFLELKRILREARANQGRRRSRQKQSTSLS